MENQIEIEVNKVISLLQEFENKKSVLVDTNKENEKAYRKEAFSVCNMAVDYSVFESDHSPSNHIIANKILKKILEKKDQLATPVLRDQLDEAVKFQHKKLLKRTVVEANEKEIKIEDPIEVEANKVISLLQEFENKKSVLVDTNKENEKAYTKEAFSVCNVAVDYSVFESDHSPSNHIIANKILKKILEKKDQLATPVLRDQLDEAVKFQHKKLLKRMVVGVNEKEIKIEDPIEVKAKEVKVNDSIRVRNTKYSNPLQDIVNDLKGDFKEFQKRLSNLKKNFIDAFRPDLSIKKESKIQVGVIGGSHSKNGKSFYNVSDLDTSERFTIVAPEKFKNKNDFFVRGNRLELTGYPKDVTKKVEKPYTGERAEKKFMFFELSKEPKIIEYSFKVKVSGLKVDSTDDWQETTTRYPVKVFEDMGEGKKEKLGGKYMGIIEENKNNIDTSLLSNDRSVLEIKGHIRSRLDESRKFFVGEDFYLTESPKLVKNKKLTNSFEYQKGEATEKKMKMGH